MVIDSVSDNVNERMLSCESVPDGRVVSEADLDCVNERVVESLGVLELYFISMLWSTAPV